MGRRASQHLKCVVVLVVSNIVRIEHASTENCVKLARIERGFDGGRSVVVNEVEEFNVGDL